MLVQLFVNDARCTYQAYTTRIVGCNGKQHPYLGRIVGSIFSTRRLFATHQRADRYQIWTSSTHNHTQFYCWGGLVPEDSTHIISVL